MFKTIKKWMCVKMNVEEPPEGARTVAGVAGGALFGWAAGGPAGAAIGGVLGLIIGASSDEEERRKRKL